MPAVWQRHEAESQCTAWGRHLDLRALQARKGQETGIAPLATTLSLRRPISDMWTIAGLLIVLSGCAVESSPLQDMADEGLVITKGVPFSAPPEVKLHTAQDLLTHASKYDQLISRSTAPAYTAKAHRIQHQEREAAATLMREAAADYAKRQDMAKARAIYQSIVTNFPEEKYGPIRRAAESALTQLNDMEKEAK